MKLFNGCDCVINPIAMAYLLPLTFQSNFVYETHLVKEREFPQNSMLSDRGKRWVLGTGILHFFLCGLKKDKLFKHK